MRKPTALPATTLGAGRLALWSGLVATTFILSGQHAARAKINGLWPQTVISTGADGAQSVFAADVDGDGDIDVLSASFNDDKIAWYENSGATPPVWTARTISVTANGADSVFAADVDGDGDVDVLSASNDDSKIAWYENNGGSPPAWTARTISTAANGAQSVFAADVDRDGDMDVLSASIGDDKIAWYANNGASPPVWTARTITTAANAANSVFAADVDGDGDTDVLSASEFDDKIAWYENNGASPPVFTARTISTAADGANSVFAADVDGDGDIDVLSSSIIDNKIAWYENDGASPPVFTARTIYTISSTTPCANSVVAADLDGDGDLDVLAACQNGDTARADIYSFENDGASPPTWDPDFVTHAADNAARAVLAADLDGDGDADVVSASSPADKIAWYENRTMHRNASFFAPTVISTRADSVSAADLDGDGDTDVLSASLNDDKIAWYANNGASPPAFTARTIATTANGPTSVFAADVDGDGDADVLSASQFDDKIAWYENDGASPPVWTEHVISLVADQARSVFAADVDGDGDTDVLSASAGDQKIAWYENSGASPPVWTARTISAAANGAESVFAADVDGDGDFDVLSASANDDKIAWYENNGAKPPVFTARTITTAADAASSVFAADVDGDGDTDVLSASSFDDKIAWYDNNGARPPVWTARTISDTTGGAFTVFAADMDGDGDMDVLSTSALSGNSAWYENDGASSPSWIPRDLSTSSFDNEVFVADVDGDGDADIASAFATAFGGATRWYENRGGQFALPTTNAAPGLLEQGDPDDVLKIVATHNGRAGDAAVRLDRLELLFEESAGDPLTSAEANALMLLLELYRDTGSGVFEQNADTLVRLVDTLALTNGVQILDIQGAATIVAHGAPGTFFVVVVPATDAAAQVPNRFRVTHLAASSAARDNTALSIPLSLEFAPDVSSSLVNFSLRVIAVSPPNNALDVPVGSNVIATFSHPVAPAAVTPATFRLLAPGGTQVAANLSLAPGGVAVTLDPSITLSVNTLYTVEVTSGVMDASGAAAVPFTSRFTTCGTGSPDSDGDLHSDGCDCAPADPTVFSAPQEIQSLLWSDRTTLSWSSGAASSGSATRYDVMSGNLAQVAVLGTGPADVCLANNLDITQAVDSLAPPLAGTGRFYLVRGDNACGQGRYETTSTGQDRASTICM